jgi:glycosyltransferase involved in cell wall biosynthesis
VKFEWIDDEDLLLDAYAASDFFVMPSTAEAFGMMAIEAMACARPVIVYDGTSLPEVTAAPHIGLSVRNGDVAGLAAAIERLINAPEECERRGIDGRRYAERHYDGRLHTKRLVALYHQVIDERRRQTDAKHARAEPER